MTRRASMIAISAAAILGIAGICAVAAYSTPPAGFPAGTAVTIEKGATLSQAADLLSSKRLIKSRLLFRIYATLLDGTTGLKSGQYAFDGPQSSLWIAYRMVHGIEGFPLVKTTIPEGSNVAQIGAILSRSIPGFDAAGFDAQAEKYEGTLFPDTYFWPVNVQPSQVIADMRAEFEDKIAGVASRIAAFGKSRSDVIAMASIVEREAASSTDRRIIAGILWNRLSIGMPLQVDPPFFYLEGKSSSQLTAADLATSSPYNLYAHAGLPPTPIDNPGLDAIVDTVTPTKTSYLYYLSGKDGAMHYAQTLDQHNANKSKYL
ncbi:MAG: endolytic transglycosylase MltG [Patescibacteria group bacterium]|nr:endolytic transglycosylase MltG [Patescibacteria group bacterium]